MLMGRRKKADKPDKIEALRSIIWAECDRQGFTVQEFSYLVNYLTSDLNRRNGELMGELFFEPVRCIECRNGQTHQESGTPMT